MVGGERRRGRRDVNFLSRAMDEASMSPNCLVCEGGSEGGRAPLSLCRILLAAISSREEHRSSNLPRKCKKERKKRLCFCSSKRVFAHRKQRLPSLPLPIRALRNQPRILPTSSASSAASAISGFRPFIHSLGKNRRRMHPSPPIAQAGCPKGSAGRRMRKRLFRAAFKRDPVGRKSSGLLFHYTHNPSAARTGAIHKAGIEDR